MELLLVMLQEGLQQSVDVVFFFTPSTLFATARCGALQRVVKGIETRNVAQPPTWLRREIFTLQYRFRNDSLFLPPARQSNSLRTSTFSGSTWGS